MAGTISRRSAMGLLGAGGLAGALAANAVGALDVPGATAGHDGGRPPMPPGAAGSVPVQVGQRFGRWAVSAVHPIQDGALDVTVQGADGKEFVLQVLARDPSPLALQPPATTQALAVFVHNAGDGVSPTDEEQGLAAMTLAHHLESSGHGGLIAGLLTHAEHITRHRAALAAGGGEHPSRAS